MINIAVVDDDASSIKRLTECIERVFKGDKSSFSVTAFSDGLDLLDNYKPVYDVIFLDIQMKHSQGVEIAKRLRATDNQTILVFVTNLAKYAIEGYSVQASDYLLKPFSYEKFSYSFGKIVSLVASKEKKTIEIFVNKVSVRLDVSTILYAEVCEHNLTYHTLNGDYVVWDSLSNAEAALSKFGFAKCNNCYLVNLKFVRQIKGDFVTVGDTELKMSRTYKQSFKKALVSNL